MNNSRVRGYVIVAAVLAAAGTADGAITHLGSFGGHDYYYNDQLLWHTDARTAALAFDPGHSTLVAINTQAEQDQINIWIPHIPNVGPVYWIGLNAEANPGGGIGAFNTWESGELVTYTNWAGDATFDNPQMIYTSGNWNVGGLWLNLPNFGNPDMAGKGSVIEVNRIIPTPGGAFVLGLAGVMLGSRRRR